MIPVGTWGSNAGFGAEWDKRNCNEVVGGSSEKKCSSIYPDPKNVNQL